MAHGQSAAWRIWSRSPYLLRAASVADERFVSHRYGGRRSMHNIPVSACAPAGREGGPKKLDLGPFRPACPPHYFRPGGPLFFRLRAQKCAVFLGRMSCPANRPRTQKTGPGPRKWARNRGPFFREKRAPRSNFPRAPGGFLRRRPCEGRRAAHWINWISSVEYYVVQEKQETDLIQPCFWTLGLSKAPPSGEHPPHARVAARRRCRPSHESAI